MDIDMEVSVSGNNGSMTLRHRREDQNTLTVRGVDPWEGKNQEAEIEMSDSVLLELKRAIDKIIGACDIA